MSISITINDTHDVVQRLQAKGASKDLAEEIVATIKSASVASDPATKADLATVEGNLRAELYRALLVHGFATLGAVIGSAVALAAFLQ